MLKILLLLITPLILVARDWTVLVYMAADNGLAPWADLDLIEMQEIGSNDDITILVQVDKPNIGARRLLVENGASYELQNLGIIDMCDWQVLSDFLGWGIINFPAQRYCVILWDHGSGWVAAPNRSFGSDWSSGNVLGIYDFRKAISTTFNYTGKKIDLFAFDACLMQQIEVAHEIRDYVEIFLAPQTVCPLQGLRYDEILKELQSNPSIDENDLSKKMIQSTVDNYSGIQPIVISSVDVGNLNILKQRFDDLYNCLTINSPNQSFLDLRQNVQTIPLSGYETNPDDEYVDFGDLIEGLHNMLLNSETSQLLDTYNSTVIQADYWGEDFSDITGLTVWFPAEYSEFKQLLNYYANLTWANSNWLEFLNWFYDKDDIRPTGVSITSTKIRSNNDFNLFWHGSHDLAPITYNLLEAEDSSRIFEDACEDSSFWNFNGFELTTDNFYSGNYAFFSGDGNNLKNSIETKSQLFIENFGLLSIYLYYNTEEMADSLIIEYGPYKDAHYGWSNGWQERRVILPPGNYSLKISYITDGSINRGGCYIDDISIDDLKSGRYIRQNYSDTTIYIFNKLRGEYFYTVFPEDKYGNLGNLSNLHTVSIKNFALPYSNPNPFQNSCDIILDYPDTLNPTVEIFSITGRKVRIFGSESIQNNMVHWDGKDGNNRDVGSGIYFILIRAGSFKTIGKIARQR
jgi:hypothetical protein